MIKKSPRAIFLRWFQSHRPKLLESRAGTEPDENFYVARPNISSAVEDLLDRRLSFCLYGAPGQGKTQFLYTILKDRKVILIECQSKLKRPQIYRIILSRVGYSVEIGQKRQATINADGGISIFETGFKTKKSNFTERSTTSVTVDLGNPTELAHVLANIVDPPCIVLNNFHDLNGNTKRNTLRDLQFLSESSDVQFAIVGNWSESYYLDQYCPGFSSKFHMVKFPVWTKSELTQFAREYCDHYKLDQLPEEQLAALVEEADSDLTYFSSFLNIIQDVDPSHMIVNRPEFSEPNIVNLLSAAKEQLFNRNRSVFYDRISSFVQKDAGVCFVWRPDVTLKEVPNPNYVHSPAAEVSTHTRQAVAQFDDSGRPRTMEVAVVGYSLTPLSLSRRLIMMASQTCQAGKKAFGLDELRKHIEKVALSDTVEIDSLALARNVRRTIDIQRRSGIFPVLLSVSPSGDKIRVDDRLFVEFLKRESNEDLLDAIGDIEVEMAHGRHKRAVRTITQEKTNDRLTLFRDVVAEALSNKEDPPWPWVDDWNAIGERAVRVFSANEPHILPPGD